MRTRYRTVSLVGFCGFLLVLFLAFGPGIAAPEAQEKENAKADPPIAILDPPESMRPGDPLLVWVVSIQPLEESSAILYSQSGKTVARAKGFRAQTAPAEKAGYLAGFLLAVPSTMAAGGLRLEIGGRDTQGTEFSLTSTLRLEPKKFFSEDIPLDRANTALRTAPDSEKTAQSEAFAKIFETADQEAVHLDSTMTRPLGVWRVTAGFADRRRYLYAGGGTDTILHGGLDLGAATGTPVMACGPGRVVYSGERIVTGNTIVIEHLPGLFSIYMHMSSRKVESGAVVAAADIIGAVGSTGLSTGPHLHWELRLGGLSVNPEYWLDRSPLDKKTLAGTMSRLIEGR